MIRKFSAIATALFALLASTARADTFVLVHGAFQDASAWNDVSKHLTSKGHKSIAVDLPGRNAVGVDLKTVSLEDYRKAVLDVIDKQAEPVVLVGHSFGGFTISAVAEAAPLKVKRLVYVAAYLPISGDSLQTLSAQDKGNKFSKENFVLAPDYSYAEVLKRDRALIFANDAAADLQKRVEETLVREPLKPIAQPVVVTAEKFGSVAKAYVRTASDNAVSPALQDMLMTRWPIKTVIRLDTGHSPFLTQPAELAAALIASIAD